MTHYYGRLASTAVRLLDYDELVSQFQDWLLSVCSTQARDHEENE